MKIIRGFKVRGFILAAAFSAGLGFATSASAQLYQSYLVDLNSKTVTDIGNLGGDYSIATGINDTGQVVGWSDTAGGATVHAFITGPDGMGMRDLGTLGGIYSAAQDINDTGQVIGVSEVGTILDRFPSGFITGPNGVGMTRVGITHVVAGPGEPQFVEINNVGQAAGDFQTQLGFHAFVTGLNGVGRTELVTPGGTDSFAGGINNAGQVVGTYFDWDHDPDRAFITGPDGVGMTDLGTLGGAASRATDINNAGQVVGASSTTNNMEHVFLTGPNGVGMGDLGFAGNPNAINDAGQIVGGFFAGSSSHAFVTGLDGVGMTDLNLLANVPAGIILTEAVDINNLGQAIAIGTIPEPEIYALFLAGLALVGFVVRRKKMGGEAFSLG